MKICVEEKELYPIYVIAKDTSFCIESDFIEVTPEELNFIKKAWEIFHKAQGLIKEKLREKEVEDND